MIVIIILSIKASAPISNKSEGFRVLRHINQNLNSEIRLLHVTTIVLLVREMYDC